MTYLLSVVSWASLGYILLFIGLIATAVSSRRYLLGYWLLGMGYWLFIEGLHALLLLLVSPMYIWQGYVLAILLSIIMLVSIGYYYSKRVQGATDYHRPAHKTPLNEETHNLSKGSGGSEVTPANRYIEHTPIYSKYTPKLSSTPSFHFRD